MQKLPEIGSSLPGGSGLGTKVLDRSDNANLEITPISERVAFGPASFGKSPYKYSVLPKHVPASGTGWLLQTREYLVDLFHITTLPIIT